jgi:two-component system response regulator HydG
LRDRLSDIEPLANHFVSQFNRIHHREIKGISKSALQVCLQYPWPGNVRELENVMERAVILSPGEFIVPESLPANVRESRPATSGETFQHLTLEESLERAEKQIILETLESFRWNRQLSARTLGVSRTTLFNKMRRLQLVDPRRSSPESPTESPSSQSR